MRRPFGDSGAVLVEGVMVIAPARPRPLTVASERAMLEVVRGERRPLVKAVRFAVVRERSR